MYSIHAIKITNQELYFNYLPTFYTYNLDLMNGQTISGEKNIICWDTKLSFEEELIMFYDLQFFN